MTSKKHDKNMTLPLPDLEVREQGRIAYLNVKSKEDDRIHKLMNIGVIPGINITLHQKFPCYVFQIGESQFAVDKELASAIFVNVSRNA